MTRAAWPIIMAVFAGSLVLPHRLQAQPEFTGGGFFKLHAITGDLQDIAGYRGNQELFVPHIPVVPDSNKTNHAILHARTSRLWLRARQRDTAIGNVEFMVEGDLFGDYSGYRPRLRHAYLAAGSFLAGQTWSTFINTSARADIDSGTAVGNMVTRHHQLRWTRSMNEDWQWQVALETPLNRLHYTNTTNIVAWHYDSRPDMVARLQASKPWGNVSLSLLARELSADAPWRNFAGSTSALAWSVAGRINTGALDNLRFMVNHGAGLARYATLGTYADAVVETSGAVDAVTTSSGLLAWQHYWTPQWRSTFAWSRSLSSLPGNAGSSLTRNAESLHFNLIWAPGTRYSLGGEFLYAARGLVDGREGDISRLQFTFRLNF
jgi:hypothetical protein